MKLYFTFDGAKLPCPSSLAFAQNKGSL